MFLLSNGRTLHTIFLCEEKKEGRVNSSTVVEETSKDALEGKDTRIKYYLVSYFPGSPITGEYTWMIDSGASKHMSGYKGALSNLNEKQFSCMVELGDNSTYSIQGFGSTSFQLSLGDTLHM